jgi:molybdenum cofactor synthesis domain-containing protein
MPNPTAAIVVIGNEILSGRTADGNVAHMARRLADIGVVVREVRMVPDVAEKIIEAVNALRPQFSYVLTTGGIGPTHDDITIASLAKAFGVGVERHPVVEAKLKTYYAGRETAATLRMADFPAGARIVWHPEGWAPGCMLENVVVLAGSPKYMHVMLEAALPLLRQGDPIFTKSIDGWITESQIAAELGAIQERFAQLDIGSYPYRIEGRAGTALVVRGTDAAAVDSAHAACQALLAKYGAELRAA